MFRRSVSFVLTAILCVWGGYQLAWHKDAVHKVFEHPAQTIGWLAAVVVALVAFVSAVNNPQTSKLRKAIELALGITLGIIAGINAKYIFAGFNKWFVLGFFGVLLALVILWVFTTFPKLALPNLVDRLFPLPSKSSGSNVPRTAEDDTVHVVPGMYGEPPAADDREVLRVPSSSDWPERPASPHVGVYGSQRDRTPQPR